MVLPAMIFVYHRRGLKGDSDALEIAQRWSKVGAVLFAAGAVSGTILSSASASTAGAGCRADGTGDLWSSWINPTPLLGGVLDRGMLSEIRSDRCREVTS